MKLWTPTMAGYPCRIMCRAEVCLWCGCRDDSLSLIHASHFHSSMRLWNTKTLKDQSLHFQGICTADNRTRTCKYTLYNTHKYHVFIFSWQNPWQNYYLPSKDRKHNQTINLYLILYIRNFLSDKFFSQKKAEIQPFFYRPIFSFNLVSISGDLQP